MFVSLVVLSNIYVERKEDEKLFTYNFNIYRCATLNNTTNMLIHD